ncbi:hypothetical protein [Isoptericola croceus]|uniref:hypothetical protein n=1 Tax=Isoptericola croceus TaxID=3031406 RepID=UPI0023F78EED|nr:hypothetical protein [Isoptericola croceus]
MADSGAGGLPGRVVLEDRVVVKVARQAAATASCAVGSRLTGNKLPDVEVELAGQRARVRARVAAEWPEPAEDVAARVRDAVRGELERDVGVSVDDLVVTVAAVVPGRASGRQSERTVR